MGEKLIKEASKKKQASTVQKNDGFKRARPTAQLKLEAFCFGYEHKDEDLKEIKFPGEYQNGLLAAALIGYSYANDVNRVYKGDRKSKSRQGWIRCDGCGMKLQFKKDVYKTDIILRRYPMSTM